MNIQMRMPGGRPEMPGLHNIISNPPSLLSGGLFDAEDCFGAWNLYKAIRAQSPETNARLVMGPWYHGQWSSTDGTHLGNIDFGSNTSVTYQNEIEIPFFNYYLKGKNDPRSRGPPFFLPEKINGGILIPGQPIRQRK